MEKIAIITPTYNRQQQITRLYHSLTEQTSKDFIWIIVDDGSDDKTEASVESFVRENCFEIRYYRQINSGKGAALNSGFRNNPDITFFAVVDSDDWLNKDAILTIRKSVDRYINNEEVGAIFFQYTDKDGNPLVTKKKKRLNKECCLTRYQHDSIYAKEDGCVGYYMRCVKKYRYPVFQNENYIGPIVIQMLMAKEYKIAFTMETVGIAEYQTDGLTASGRKLRLRNPCGMILYCGLLQSRENKRIMSRIKYSIEAQAYAHIAHIRRSDLTDKGINERYVKRWAYLFGVLLARLWKENA